MLTLLARAKINLTLDILGKRDDGYHELESVMQSIELCDRLRIVPAERLWLQLDVKSSAAQWLPVDRRNDVLRAAMLLRERYGIKRGALLRLRKIIPVQAGLGGGSSDAAAALIGLNRFWRLNLSLEELCQIAAELGSDTVFALSGGTALCRGRGERVTALPQLPARWLTLFKPPRGLSTARVFQALDPKHLPSPQTPALLARLRRPNPGEDALEHIGNHLQATAFAMLGELGDFSIELDRRGYRWQMSGSGTTLFALAADQGDAQQLRSLAPKGWWSVATRTATRGVEIITEI